MRLRVLFFVALAGCGGTRELVDSAMASAYRPDEAVLAATHPRFRLLAGDLHTHVRPPDHNDVTRDLAETVRLAEQEKLDFVVLTPHVPARFFEREEERASALDGQRLLRDELARLAPKRTTFIRGMEYTDHAFGHVGLSFGDLEATLADVSIDAARAHPEAFVEAWAKHGGLITLNHPLVTPIDSLFAVARADLSFRPLTSKGPFPAEIAAFCAHANGIEAYNLSATHLRDRLLLVDEEASLRGVLDVVDHGRPDWPTRRPAPVGGSDSHGHYLRATTFVLAEGLGADAVRAAILAGRTCVRSPEACSFEARAASGAWVVPGEAVRGVAIEARASGTEIEVIVNGEVRAMPASGEVAHLELDPSRCAILRARVGEGWSAPIYANCAGP